MTLDDSMEELEAVEHIYSPKVHTVLLSVESPQLTSRIVSMSFNTLPIREPVGERVI